MAYTKEQMVYKDQYKWTAKSDKDNPKIRNGKDADELNLSEGYEIKDFINSLAESWNWKDKPVELYNDLERIIINKVPYCIFINVPAAYLFIFHPIKI